MSKVLILGGTRFIGRRLVEHLMKDRRFEITLFHRGISGDALFPELPVIRGDRRTSDIQQIRGTDWDFIVDLSSYYPDSLARLLQYVPAGLKKYIYVSTISVYDQAIDPTPLKEENAALLSCTESERTDESPATYGKRKAACEAELRVSGIPHCSLRPAVVYGPYDYTDRLYYWLYQVYHRVLLPLPEGGCRPIALTWVGDIARTVESALTDGGITGPVNLVSHEEVRIRDIVTETAAQLNRNPILIDLPEDFLNNQKVDMWSDMPLWIASDQHTISSRKLREEWGFHPTSLAAALRETIRWNDERGWPPPGSGLSSEALDNLLIKFNFKSV